ncbi:hypothetical protein QOT17_024259 [Balamuthia mandrillaris]
MTKLDNNIDDSMRVKCTKQGCSHTVGPSIAAKYQKKPFFYCSIQHLLDHLVSLPSKKQSSSNKKQKRNKKSDTDEEEKESEEEEEEENYDDEPNNSEEQATGIHPSP